VGSDFRSISCQPQTDPDMYATLSDFMAYTEHLPSHITRSLGLIANQRARSEHSIRSIHNHATIYSRLPACDTSGQDPVELRRSIFYALEESERASRMAVEEATRLSETCHREAERLKTVTEKLKAQPLPPSRDPTPELSGLTSPNLRREHGMSMRIEDTAERPTRHLADKTGLILRGRKIIVSGEVLPPPDPNAPVDNMSEWSSPRASPVPEASHGKLPLGPRSRSPKPPKERRPKEKKQRPRAPRAPGQSGTNARSGVAGISTSNALLALVPPPADAVKGSKWLPWTKLTEWELARLRKRMKKNAVWIPSATMVRRELKDLGRGVAVREETRVHAEANGTIFVDESTEPDPTRAQPMNPIAAPSVDTEQMVVDDEADAETSNRGIRLNEAKKLKRQRAAEEERELQQVKETHMQETQAGAEDRKRKREPSPIVPPIIQAAASVRIPVLSAGLPPVAPPAVMVSDPPPPPAKRVKVADSPPPETAPGETQPAEPVDPMPADTNPVETKPTPRAGTPPAKPKPAVTLKVDGGRATSEELPRRSRRTMQFATPEPRRSKRPAPGILTTSDAGDAKVGVSKRKAAPRKKRQAEEHPAALPAVEEEYIDPDEPRYCTCGDVSWGSMIACDNDDCDKEWFHMSCVGLDEPPPRLTKWYCPDCRKKLKVGLTTNGLVGR
ncbi:hypothetical protein K470DRAFT_207911, partial [Piedraia hortae CBS 480.64]